MKAIPVTQNSDEWRKARFGIPTASRFGDIVTAKGEARTGEMPKKYMCELVAERILGESLPGFQTHWTQRGKDYEATALMAAEEKLGVLTEPGGFITTDDGRLGCSPDGVITRLPTIKGEIANIREAVEVKVPAPHTHIYNILYGPGDNHVQQMQGQMFVGEFDIVHFFSWNPGLPDVLVTTERDIRFINRMAQALNAFCDELDQATQYVRSLIAKGADAPEIIRNLNPF